MHSLEDCKKTNLLSMFVSRLGIPEAVPGGATIPEAFPGGASVPEALSVPVDVH